RGTRGLHPNACRDQDQGRDDERHRHRENQERNEVPPPKPSFSRIRRHGFLLVLTSTFVEHMQPTPGARHWTTHVEVCWRPCQKRGARAGGAPVSKAGSASSTRRANA